MCLIITIGLKFDILFKNVINTMCRIIFYYQTFKTEDNKLISLDSILYEGTPVTHIHVSAIHFGRDVNKDPYIHLNNRPPGDSYFDGMWVSVKQASSKNMKIIAMIGGAGGGYACLFSDFEVYYRLLCEFIKQRPFINGIDLDIEESCDINNIKKLINRIVSDFGKDFIITVAPLQGSLEQDTPGMGGFCYKDLLKSTEGAYIDYINCQSYGSYTLDSLEQIIKNGYNTEQIVMGMISGEEYSTELTKMYSKYGDHFGGVFIWEYFNATPTPLQWCKTVGSIIK